MNSFIENKLYLIKDIRQKGFLHLLSANLLIQVVAFASQLFVAGILAPDDIGRIKIIQTYLSIFSIIAGMGFNASTLKLCSEKKNTKEQSSLFRSALFFTLISTLIIYIIVLLLNYFQIFTSDKLIIWLIPLGLFPIISNSIFMVFISYFQATKKIKLLSKLTFSNKIISILAIILLSYLWGIKGYYLAYNLSFLLMIVVCIIVYKSAFSDKFFSFSKSTHFTSHWKYAKSSIFANLFSEMSAYIDIILISFLVKDMKEIGFYSFALTITVILRLFPGTVQQITSPYFSSMAQNKNEFTIAFKRYNKILYSVVLVTLVLVWIIVPFITHSIFNGKYDQSMPYFILLAVGWSLRQLTQLQSGAIFGLGKIQYNAYISLITLLFNTLIVSISIYYFGLIGAAYASIPGGLVFILTSRYFYNKAYLEMV